MLTRTHLTFSIFIFLILFPYLDFLNRFVFFGFLLLGTLIVDIDTSKSRVGKAWYLRPLQWFTKHRGMWHSLIFGLFLSVVIYVFSQDAGFGFFVGYVLHLFSDCFTKSGVRMFWPITNRKVRFGLVRSGGLIEEVLFVLLLLGDLWLVWGILF